MDKYHVKDLETIVNCFVAVCKEYISGKVHIFRVWPGNPLTGDDPINEISAYYQYLLECKRRKVRFFTFNGFGFDSQVIEHIMRNPWLLNGDPTQITQALYAVAQETISLSRAREKPKYPEHKLSHTYHDIYLMNNWDSTAKSASLKWIQFNTRWLNVEEMPYPHYEPVITRGQLNEVVRYCVNDVESTSAAYSVRNSRGELEMHNQIKLRKVLSDTYNVSLQSAPEPKISKEIFLHFLSEQLGMEKREIRHLRSERNEVPLAPIILPEISFKRESFQSVLDWFRDMVVDTSLGAKEAEKKKAITKTIYERDVKTVYALGGIHGCTKPGVYEAADGFTIVTADVTSFYPMLAIKNRWSPYHLDNALFCELYEWFFHERKKYSKKDPLNYLFKIILNATYGLSKSRYSFLYDPEMTFKITINGQLLLSMLYEMVLEEIPDAVPLMQNTDGLEFMMPEAHKPLFMDICSRWEKISKMSLEHDEYSKMIIRDVNNYISVFKEKKAKSKEDWLTMQQENPTYRFREDGTDYYYTATKCKGRFEFADRALHKDSSYMIVAKALYAYFIDGTPPEDYLAANRDIFDYCAGLKLRGGAHFEAHYVDQTGTLRNDRLKKLIRYYMSPEGVKLVKVNGVRQEQVEATKGQQRLFNQYVEKPWADYLVDEDYYLKAIWKEIRTIEQRYFRQQVAEQGVIF